MSGGERKKRTSRGQGWEEAGAEFYQESYPADVDLEVLQRDPSHIATLLPSKQSRAATSKRVRGEVKPTLRRRTSTRSRYASTARRASAAHDVHVAMLPDLSENLSNEERTWEEIMQIKAMPVSMSQKKEMKAKLQTATKLRLQGFEQFKWQRRKVWQQMKGRWKETYAKLELWRHSLKKIEGNFGTGVVAYFLFIKWLMFLNFTIFLIILLFVIVPTLVLIPYEAAVNNNISYVEECSRNYTNQSWDASFLDWVQGTGDMERTIMFYGYYNYKLLSADGGPPFYNLPLAYVAVAVVYLLGSWDYCIHNEKSANIKHKALYHEMKACLEAERLEEERQNRSRDEMTRLVLTRCIINLIVLVVLSGALALIYFTFTFAREKLEQDDIDQLYKLLLEFLPSITIVGLNLLVPNLFTYLVSFERYSPLFVVRITLLRTILLRLASLIMLMVSLNDQFNCKNEEKEKCDCSRCWETNAGQEVYKLVILDFVSHILVTFAVNWPRMLIAKYSKSKIAKFIGDQEFELPKHVLDVVYSQTLCWLGSFYAPVLPLVAMLECCLLFHIKKFACLINSRPSSTVYRASRSNSLFMAVLLISFIVAVLPVAYAIAELTPSKSCGPFRGNFTTWSVVVDSFEELPDWIKSILFFFGTAGFAVPMFIVLVLCLYYFYAVSTANKQMVAVLKNQLVLEGHDKQFLLNRLSAFIKQQQEHQKAMRGHLDLSNAS
ncbi:Transmembrane channel-like protein 7 [Blattella germanica]|nr:Transmembrane channel-like protein 7 [Blattella germanica]